MEELVQSYDSDSQDYSNNKAVDDNNISFFNRL